MQEIEWMTTLSKLFDGKVKMRGGVHLISKITPNYIEYIHKGHFDNCNRIWYEWEIAPTITTNDITKILVEYVKQTFEGNDKQK